MTTDHLAPLRELLDIVSKAVNDLAAAAERNPDIAALLPALSGRAAEPDCTCEHPAARHVRSFCEAKWCECGYYDSRIQAQEDQ